MRTDTDNLGFDQGKSRIDEECEVGCEFFTAPPDLCLAGYFRFWPLGCFGIIGIVASFIFAAIVWSRRRLGDASEMEIIDIIDVGAMLVLLATVLFTGLFAIVLMMIIVDMLICGVGKLLRCKSPQ